MTGVAVVLVVLAGVAYLTLRRARPVGVALNPWPYVMRENTRYRFERMWPTDPAAPICNATPPAELLRTLDAAGLSLTRCCQQPHPLRPGVAHVGIVVPRERVRSDVPFSQHYTWVEPGPDPRVARTRPRPAWWRRALLRLATS